LKRFCLSEHFWIDLHQTGGEISKEEEMKRCGTTTLWIVFSVVWTLITPLELRAAQPPGVPGETPLPQEFIVLLGEGPAAPSAEEVVNQANRRQPLPGGLGEGSPNEVRFVIPQPDRKGIDHGKAGDRLLRYIVMSYPLHVNVEAVKAALEHNPNVLWVGYNWPMEVSATPNDPYFSVAASPDLYQWGLYSLKMPEAWDYNKGRAYVGVIDLGIDTTHPDLKTYNFDAAGNLTSIGNYRRQFGFDYGYPADNCSLTPGNDCSGAPSKDCVDEGQPQVELGSCRMVDRAGHGTHVAGIVAATANNSQGVAGTCWGCSLIISKVTHLYFDSFGKWVNAATTQADVAAAINGSITKGAQVLNMSLGWRPNDTEPAPDCANNPNHVLCTALEFLQDRDIVLSAAVGNDFSNIVDFPASDSRTIAVGGITSNGSFWNDCVTPGRECGGSNYSPEQVVAPAKQILSTFYRGIYYQGAGQVCPGFDPYGLCTGTSMAAPHIAGAAGVLRSVNPLLSKETIKGLLRTYVENPSGWNLQYGKGKPNISTAIQAALGKSAGVQLPNRLTPLFSLYSSWVEDYFYTTVPQMAAMALLDSGAYRPQGPATPGYILYPGTQCRVSPCFDITPTASVYIFTGDRAPIAGAPPLVPLYRLSFKGPNPNGNANHRDTTYTTELAGIQAFHTWGYEVDGIEGYIYQKCTPEPSCMPAGTVRLYRRYHPQRDDFAIFPESELAQMEAQGYTSTGGGSDVLGYVYPNVDSDGDTLIDGFERLAGTNPAVADSDFDGKSDGAELLNFPYSDPLPPRDALVLSQSVPTTMAAGRKYQVSLTLKNVGTETWSPVGAQCGAYRLGSANPLNNGTWGLSRVELPAPVAPGGQVTLSFTVTAPWTPGTYNFQWQMVQECVTWFPAPTPNVAVTVTPAPARSAQILSQSVPSSMVTGASYPVSITIRNVGTLTWSPIGPQCNAYRLGSANPYNNGTWLPATRVELPTTLAPGGEVTLNFTVTAPSTSGTYNFQWQMVQECVTWFGDLTPNVPVEATVFADVPLSYWARSFIESLYFNNITGGCASNPRRYCPDTPITRADTAVFLIKAKGPAGYTPPPATCSPLRFQDVPCTTPEAPYIEEFARRGITSGCGGGNYCPTGTVSRGTMAYFLLATLGIPPPTSCTGIFSDVPCTAWYAPWVEELYRRGITSGCGAGVFCPENLTARSEAAVFVKRTFNLPLP
jgi:serine protease